MYMLILNKGIECSLFLWIPKIFLILIVSFLLLKFLVRKLGEFWQSCIDCCEEIDHRLHEVLDLVRQEKIPILEAVLALGVLQERAPKEHWITERDHKVYAAIRRKYHIGLYRGTPPEVMYNIYKRELLDNYAEYAKYYNSDEDNLPKDSDNADKK